MLLGRGVTARHIRADNDPRGCLLKVVRSSVVRTRILLIARRASAPGLWDEEGRFRP